MTFKDWDYQSRDEVNENSGFDQSKHHLRAVSGLGHSPARRNVAHELEHDDNKDPHTEPSDEDLIQKPREEINYNGYGIWQFDKYPVIKELDDRIPEEVRATELLKVIANHSKRKQITAWAEQARENYDATRMARHIQERQRTGLRRAVLRWVQETKEPQCWFDLSHVPSRIKFLVRRPYLPTAELHQLLQNVGISPRILDCHIEGVPQNYNHSSQLRGHDNDTRGQHVSILYRHHFPYPSNEVAEGIAFSSFNSSPRPARANMTLEEELDTLQAPTEVRTIYMSIVEIILRFRCGTLSLDEAVQEIEELLNYNTIDPYVEELISNTNESAVKLAESIYIDMIAGYDDEEPDEVISTEDSTAHPIRPQHTDHQGPIAANPLRLKAPSDLSKLLKEVYISVLQGNHSIPNAIAKFRKVLDMPQGNAHDLAEVLRQYDIPIELFFDPTELSLNPPRTSQSKLSPASRPVNVTVEDTRDLSNKLKALRSGKSYGHDLTQHASVEVLELPAETTKELDKSSWKLPDVSSERDLSCETTLSNTMGSDLDQDISVDDEVMSKHHTGQNGPISTGVEIEKVSGRSQKASLEMAPPERPLPEGGGAISDSVIGRTYGDHAHKATRDESSTSDKSPYAQLRQWSTHVQGSVGTSLNSTYRRDSSSPSPEKGFTTDVWGLTMPIEDAKHTATGMKLPPDYVKEMIRTDTPQRLIKKKYEKNRHTRLIGPPRMANPQVDQRPPVKGGKRPSDASITGPRKIQKRAAREATPFAEDGEDHQSFLEKRLPLGRISKKRHWHSEDGHSLVADNVSDISEKPVFSSPEWHAKAVETSEQHCKVEQSANERVAVAFGGNMDALSELKKLTEENLHRNILQKQANAQAKTFHDDSTTAISPEQSTFKEASRLAGRKSDNGDQRKESSILPDQQSNREISLIDPDNAKKVSTSSEMAGVGFDPKSRDETIQQSDYGETMTGSTTISTGRKGTIGPAEESIADDSTTEYDEGSPGPGGLLSTKAGVSPFETEHRREEAESKVIVAARSSIEAAMTETMPVSAAILNGSDSFLAISRDSNLPENVSLSRDPPPNNSVSPKLSFKHFRGSPEPKHQKIRVPRRHRLRRPKKLERSHVDLSRKVEDPWEHKPYFCIDDCKFTSNGFSRLEEAASEAAQLRMTLGVHQKWQKLEKKRRIYLNEQRKRASDAQLANDHPLRYFQAPNGSNKISPSTVEVNLNKLFDKYRGIIRDPL